MPRLQTTVGQLMVNSALPRDMRDYNRTLDKKELSVLLRELAIKHPDKYREVSKRLSDIGWHAAYTTGGQSFGLRHLQVSPKAQAVRAALRIALNHVYSDETIDEDERDKRILRLVGKVSAVQEQEIYDEQLAAGNPLAAQVDSGSRGSKMNLASLLGSDLLYTDHHGRVIPYPVLSSYSQGLSPAEYWAGAYGARKGVIDLKMATADAGFLSKQLNQIVHRGLVTSVDADPETTTGHPGQIRGLPVDTDDIDNEGALLAQGIGGYRRNQILTPKILEDLLQQDVRRILVRSPTVGGPADGGVYARDVGVREFGKIPVQGENVSLAAAQALSEPLTQAQIASKHSGGIATASAAKAIRGFDYINQLIQVPKVFKGGAAHAEYDGTVQVIEDAAAGGYYVTIGGEKHYVGSGFSLKVKKGDVVEAGDVISEGTPNPAIITKYKGIGEGRRYFVKAFREAFRDAGLPIHRRNVELLARGLINHVRLTEEIGDQNPDDVVSYARLEHNYAPRPEARHIQPTAAIGQHLERPVLHYTIGTRIRPSVAKEMAEFGIKRIDVHKDPPPFEAEMIRGMANLQHDPDWITRMYGSGLQKGLFSAVHRGGVSDPTGTSFVPGLAQSAEFGRIGKVITPKRASLDELRARIQVNKKPKIALASLQARVRQAREKRAEQQSLSPEVQNEAVFDWLVRRRERQILDRNRAIADYTREEARRAETRPGLLRAFDFLTAGGPGTMVGPPVGKVFLGGKNALETAARNSRWFRRLLAGELATGAVAGLAATPQQLPGLLGTVPGQVIPSSLPGDDNWGLTPTGEVTASGGDVNRILKMPAAEVGGFSQQQALPLPGQQWKWPKGVSSEEQEQFLKEVGAHVPGWSRWHKGTYRSPNEMIQQFNEAVQAGKPASAENVSRIMGLFYPEQITAAVSRQRFNPPEAGQWGLAPEATWNTATLKERTGILRSLRRQVFQDYAEEAYPAEELQKSQQERYKRLEKQPNKSTGKADLGIIQRFPQFTSSPSRLMTTARPRSSQAMERYNQMRQAYIDRATESPESRQNLQQYQTDQQTTEAWQKAVTRVTDEIAAGTLSVVAGRNLLNTIRGHVLQGDLPTEFWSNFYTAVDKAKATSPLNYTNLASRRRWSGATDSLFADNPVAATRGTGRNEAAARQYGYVSPLSATSPTRQPAARAPAQTDVVSQKPQSPQQRSTVRQLSPAVPSPQRMPTVPTAPQPPAAPFQLQKRPTRLQPTPAAAQNVSPRLSMPQ